SRNKISSIFADDIRQDLTPGKGRPEWIFSCYAPVRNTPVHLFGGPSREQSFEEMRLMHYLAQAAGKAEQAVQDANILYAESEAQMQTILNNTEAAVRYVVDGSNQHPNRLDVIEGFTAAAAPAPTTTAQNPFGQNQQPPQQQANPFNQGQTGSSAFGQPSAFAQPLGMTQQQQQQSACGNPSFGQPSFGQPSFGQSSLGQPPSAQPAFGKSAFGQPSPFAQIAGGAQQQTQPNPFQQQPFGQPPQQPNPFGGQQPPAATPFSQQQQPLPQQLPNPFGQPSGSTTGGFGTVTNAAGGPFATNAQPASSTGPNPLYNAVTKDKASYSAVLEGDKPPRFTELPDNLNVNLDLTGETTHDPTTNRLILWKGQPVRYFNGEPRYQHPNNGQVFMHIFFPNGPPPIESMGDVQGKAEDYNPEIEEIYKHAKQAKRFTTKVPIVPPKVEWCSFDL
ncbi:hypothetical protein KEM54_005282, partial [Ascosphaera aggregata]